MKRYAVFVAAAFILAAPVAAWSQSSSGGTGGNTGNGGFHQEGQGDDAARFQQHKTEILQHIADHISEMQKRQSCVETANDRQALMACMPDRAEHGDWGSHGGGGFRHNNAQPGGGTPSQAPGGGSTAPESGSGNSSGQ